MKQCLNDRELVIFHSGDGSDEVRAHVESCLACARKYRELQGDMETLVSALRHPPVAASARYGSSGAKLWPRAMRWALAASMVAAAFVGGRFTGISTMGQAIPVTATVQNIPADQIAMTQNVGASTPAGYGLYIDDLMGSDSNDQDQAADQDDSDAATDTDSNAF
jgi:hypothetical protein